MSLPPDRSHLSTEERHPESADLDARTTLDCVVLMADDHRRAIEAVHAAASAIAQLVDELVERMRAGGRLIYVGAGTSGRLGVLDASECPPTFQSDPAQVVGIIAGGDAALRASSESKEDDARGASEALESLVLNPRDSLLGIAAGGTTPYVLGAFSMAKELTSGGAMTGLVTCVGRARPENCDHLIVLDTGPELLTGSTRLKAGAATKLALNAISTIAFVKLGKTYGNLMVDLRATNDKLMDRAIRILQTIESALTRDHAARLLKDARGNLKAAIVMARLRTDFASAEQILNEHQGRLRSVLGPPEGARG